MHKMSLLTRSLLSRRMSAPPAYPVRVAAAGRRPMNLGFSEPVQHRPGREVSGSTGDPQAPPQPVEKFVWVPLPHLFEGSEPVSCSAKVTDTHGFSGTCGMKYGATVHLDPGHLPAERPPGSAEPGDHVGQRQLEDHLVHHAHLDRLEAQRIAHAVVLEYDLFPKGLLLIHKGLDAEAPPRKAGWGR